MILILIYLQEKWLGDLDMEQLSLNCGIYFGDILMTQKSARGRPTLVHASRDDQYGGVTYNIEYRDE